jgi:hypothetical protein
MEKQPTADTGFLLRILGVLVALTFISGSLTVTLAYVNMEQVTAVAYNTSK